MRGGERWASRRRVDAGAAAGLVANNESADPSGRNPVAAEIDFGQTRWRIGQMSDAMSRRVIPQNGYGTDFANDNQGCGKPEIRVRPSQFAARHTIRMTSEISDFVNDKPHLLSNILLLGLLELGRIELSFLFSLLQFDNIPKLAFVLWQLTPGKSLRDAKDHLRRFGQLLAANPLDLKQVLSLEPFHPQSVSDTTTASILPAVPNGTPSRPTTPLE